jgi:hypothetical protein
LEPVEPTDKENQVKMYKKLGFGTLPLWKGKDPDPYQIDKHDPDQYQSEKQDPDQYQKGLDPQHWAQVSLTDIIAFQSSSWLLKGIMLLYTVMTES